MWLVDFFKSKDLVPHGFCLTWNSRLLWLNVLSDAIIALAYFSISILLIYFVWRRKDLQFRWLFKMCGLFILACGITHLLSIMIIWIPLYWLDGTVKAITSIFSGLTAVLMLWIMPHTLQLPSPAQLQAENRRKKEALNRLHKIAIQVPGLVYQYKLRPDGNACFPYASEAILEIFRVSSKEVREDASKILSVVHPDDVKSVMASMLSSARNLTPWRHEFRVKFDDDTVRWLLNNALPQQEADGSILWHGFATDISEHKQAENLYRLHSEILLNVSEGVQMARVKDERIVYSTPAFNNMFGYGEGELIGRHVSILNAGLDKAPETVANEINEVLNRTGTWKGEIANIRKDGILLWCWVSISTFEHHQFGKVWVAVHEDISYRTQIEQDVRLASEIAHRELLVREVHHRINNNLQGIILVLHQFACNHRAIAEPINQAISQVQSIAVIHGLQGRASFAEVRLCELTDAIATGIQTLWQIPIEVDIPTSWIPGIIAEMEAVPLALVLNELISNAVKHGGHLGQIKIMLRHDPKPDTIRITINNIGQLSPDFDFDRQSRISAGLNLVASLLPRVGALLSWQQQGDRVLTVLELQPPIITLELQAITTHEHKSR
ncbi:MAG: sensor histidine kinase [Methylococcaceae bacterium]